MDMPRHSLAVFLICLSIAIPLSARLTTAPGFEDIRSLAEHAPLVFRGQVGNIDLANKEAQVKDAVADIAVDRWYRGAPSNNLVKVHFVYAAGGIIGHNCINFEIGTYWIIFARPSRGEVLELVDDCEGALTVSSLLGPESSGGFLLQMEQDFAAGLDDSATDARIASIQRLAGLGKLSSTEALHHVIATGTEEESKWAIFAALKTGDISVLPLVVPILLSVHHKEAVQHQESSGFVYTETFPYPQPEGAIALAIAKLRDRRSVPKLIEILNGAPDELVRSCASQALMELKDARALDAFAEHLSDSSQHVRYNSLIGMEYTTHAPACTITKPEDAEKAEPLCKTWWQSRAH